MYYCYDNLVFVLMVFYFILQQLLSFRLTFLRLLFYTERGFSFPHIGKANMDGTGVTHLVVQDIDDPKRLSIDYQGKLRNILSD